METPVALVRDVRRVSRELVRELGFLRPTFGGINHSQCHALIELGERAFLTVAELARLLRLDKSSASRSVADLARRGLVSVRAGAEDRRRKIVCLTPKGRAQAERIHKAADTRVAGALSVLGENDRHAILQGLGLYSGALARSRAAEGITIRRIRRADDESVARIIRTVMTEFGATGPGFAIHDPEVNAMHTAYSGPRKAFFVVTDGTAVVGGGGIAPLGGTRNRVCELRKMYFLPRTRGMGLGARLLARCLEAAREMGYQRCYLETLRSMTAARRLYERTGFVAVDKPMGETGHFGCDAWYVRKI